MGENIIRFGDSLTFGTGVAENMDYPCQLSRMISKPIGDPIGSHAETGHGLSFQGRQPVVLVGCGQGGIPLLMKS
ncbi:MAG: hypothetical protein HGJ94_17900 [Desulfosarcina sp.]|nr:hypothetical protein [Desulfosarcina sp.]MBC2742149.1 hypothetical protein [Desulfosarcina sp.]MBC2765061.1 hypothetical protein [Desulfosarcina sp.]